MIPRRLLAAAAAFMLLAPAVRYLDSPLRADESDFAAIVREGILRHGIPAIPVEERRLIYADPVTGLAEAHHGMWHPPLYQYMLAAAAMVLPTANWSIRIVGLLCLAGSLIVAWRMVRMLAPDLAPSLRAIPVSLMLLSPIVVEGALFVDIDGGVLNLLILLMLERWLAWRDRITPARTALLAAIVALALSAKLTTPFLAIAAMGLHALCDRRRVRLGVTLGAAAIAGALMFGAAYLAYCALTGYPADYMFRFYSLRAGVVEAKPASDYAIALRWHLAWLGPPFVLMLAVYFAARAAAIVRARAVERADLLWMFSALNLAFYAGAAAYWGKYSVPAASAGALGAGLWLAERWPAIRVTRPRVLLVCLAGLGALVLAMPVPRVRSGHMLLSAGTALWDPRNQALLALTVAPAALALIAPRLIAAPWRATAPAFMLALCLAVSAPIEQARIVFARHDNAPLSAGVQIGFDALIARLDTLEPGAMILAQKEVVYYYRGRGFGLEAETYGGSVALLRAAHHPEVKAIVDSTLYPMLSPADIALLPPSRVETIGTYRVYVKD
ncbi:MAG: glycosyltransferase family 39 protein [Acidobacteriota bacterium]|nr:glycosyltransferase family 39 protein [Acidobacteriota bacterium]